MGKTIVVTSGKGGCGKTSFAIGLGYSLANKGQKVVLLDLNIGVRNIDLYMGMESRVIFDFGDYINGTCKLSKAILYDEENNNLAMLPCPQLKGVSNFDDVALKVLCHQLASLFDYVIIDAPAGLGSDSVNASAVADELVVVLTQDHASLRGADTISKRYEAEGVKDICYAINMLCTEDLMDPALPSLENIASIMQTRLLGLVAYDKNIKTGNCLGEPVFRDRRSDAARVFDDIASRI